MRRVVLPLCRRGFCGGLRPRVVATCPASWLSLGRSSAGADAFKQSGTNGPPTFGQWVERAAVVGEGRVAQEAEQGRQLRELLLRPLGALRGAADDGVDVGRKLRLLENWQRLQRT